MRYAYAISSLLLAGGAAISLATGYPAGAQVAQNDENQMSSVVPRAGAPASFADLTEQLQPAVVNISTRAQVAVRDPMYEFFYGRRSQNTREVSALGSGFVISADGYVVTNNHVITADGSKPADSITVTMPDGTEYDATLVGRDPSSDIAVLKVNPKAPLPFVEFGDSNRARAGDWIIAIGNPFGLGGTVTSGIVSSAHRKTGTGAYDEYIQTDASINSGNSGGPMFDMRGQVIGINNAIISPTGGNIGIGFAIPAEIARPIVDKLIRGEEIQRGYLGVLFGPVSDDMADALGLQRSRGEFVRAIVPGQPADKAGLQTGDIVLKIGSSEVTKDQSASYILSNVAPDSTLKIEILREGKPSTLTATVAKRPSEEELQAQTLNTGPTAPRPGTSESDGTSTSVDGLGIKVQTITPRLARQIGGSQDMKGVVIMDVAPGGNASSGQLSPGLVVQTVNYNQVTTAEEFSAEIAKLRKAGRPSVLLFVVSPRGQSGYITVRFRADTPAP